MVKLRLKRMGSKYNAFYRIVAADARSPRDGKYIEEIGYYNPHTKEIKVTNELKDKWLKVGAVPSETVKRLFARIEDAADTKDGVKVLKVKVKKVKKQETEVKAKTVVKEESKSKEEPATVKKDATKDSLETEKAQEEPKVEKSTSQDTSENKEPITTPKVTQEKTEDSK